MRGVVSQCADEILDNGLRLELGLVTCFLCILT